MKTPDLGTSSSLSVCFFAALALVFSAFYIQLSLLGFVLILLLVFAVGAYASFRALMLLPGFFSQQGLTRSWRLALVLASWLALWYLPSSDFAAHVDVSLFHNRYKNEVAQVQNQSPDNCGKILTCYADGGQPPYVFFPYSLHLPFSGEQGVLYVPDSAGMPKQQRLDKISGAMTCQPMPLREHFFSCAMSAYGG
ncbi:hypothetical protein [Undibacterium pigrum]|uniref:hypothetical protein n=1 Tax=Undibacterium pigrum TaxID=401470 RepID=UPI000D7738E7|nr:hypothetical protein [Undibacterium pigrum]